MAARNVLYFLLLIGPLITIHELGHFLMAKLFRVKVLRFSIGFGPRLLGFTKGETQYQIAALPLGGYVKMAGDDPTEDPRPEDRGRGFLEQAPWKRSLIALAGPMTNLIFPFVIYFGVAYLQTTDYSSRVGHVDPDTPAYRAGIRDGDRIVNVDGQPVAYFDQLRDLISPKWDQPVTIELEKADGRHVTVSAVPEKHLVPGILHDNPRGVLGVSQPQLASVVAVDGDSPAGKAGILPLDHITRVAGQPVTVFSDLERVVAQQKGPFEVQFLRTEPLSLPGAGMSTQTLHTVTLTPVAGDSLEARTGLASPETVITSVSADSPAGQAGLRRGDRLLQANGKALLSWSTLAKVEEEAKTAPLDLLVLRDGKKIHVNVVQVNRTQENERGKEEQHLYFGATHEAFSAPGEQIPIHRGVFETTAYATRQVTDVVTGVTEAFFGLLTNQVSPKTVGGPVMLFDIARKTAEAGWEVFLSAMAAISVNLGVMNLIPVPVLDGFHILSAGFEWVRRRPLSLRAREIANVVGLAMLLLMMAYVLHNDLMKFVFN